MLATGRPARPPRRPRRHHDRRPPRPRRSPRPRTGAQYRNASTSQLRKEVRLFAATLGGKPVTALACETGAQRRVFVDARWDAAKLWGAARAIAKEDTAASGSAFAKWVGSAAATAYTQVTTKKLRTAAYKALPNKFGSQSDAGLRRLVAHAKCTTEAAVKCSKAAVTPPATIAVATTVVPRDVVKTCVVCSTSRLANGAKEGANANVPGLAFRPVCGGGHTCSACVLRRCPDCSACLTQGGKSFNGQRAGVEQPPSLWRVGAPSGAPCTVCNTRRNTARRLSRQGAKRQCFQSNPTNPQVDTATESNGEDAMILKSYCHWQGWLQQRPGRSRAKEEPKRQRRRRKVAAYWDLKMKMPRGHYSGAFVQRVFAMWDKRLRQKRAEGARRGDLVI